MTLLLPDAALDGRRAAAHGPLSPLLASLRAELAPLVAAPPAVPRDKARLSRAGGNCPRDGARLDFDPSSPDEHRCPRCGGVERGEAHYRAWLMWYQLWLAERAVHGALLHLIDRRPGERELATRLLAQYAESYAQFPNRDNALGPARLFFSTYLESIWLLQVCIALDFLEAADGPSALSGTLRAQVVEPAARLIASFDEGRSNRQVWNDSALIAAGLVLRDQALVENAVHGRSGLVAHLSHGLLADGSWYEGENYHVFAHRGLWYGMTMAAVAGIHVPAGLVRRFDEGYVTPWLTALPDMTLPSRRDSPHGVSLRQWRFAEMAELGLARSGDGRLAGALARLYRDDIPRADTGRSRSAADVERNEGASALTRADQGWRALLHALPSLGELGGSCPGSVVLEGQGFGVLRPDRGRVYAALDYGHSGGGHGHPDRLGVMICDDGIRWLDDPGTGSYVDPTLHWYRSTLAHNAPLVNGRSQSPTHGDLLAFDNREAAGWIEGSVRELSPGVRARRALIALPEYIVDRFEWSSADPVRMELPLHADGRTTDVEWTPVTLDGAGGLEDGFDFVTDGERATRADSNAAHPADLHPEIQFAAAAGAASTQVFLIADPPVEWLRASAPGVPGSGRHRFHLARWNGTGGRLTTIWDLRSTIASCAGSAEGTITIVGKDGAIREHGRTPGGWTIVTRGGDPPAIELNARAAGRDDRPGASAPDAIPPGARTPGARAPGGIPPGPHVIRATPLIFELGEPHYRRSEQSWHEAGEPRALVALSREDGSLVVGVRVFTAHPVFVPAGSVNDMDNEHPDVNGDGVQLHLRTGGGPRRAGRASTGGPSASERTPALTAGWVAIPEAGEQIRVREVTGSQAGWVPEGGWQRMPDGYRLLLMLPLERLGPGPARSVSLDVIVNETAPGRERRRGQLVLSGARGEWVYLRGDRQSADRLLPFLIDDA